MTTSTLRRARSTRPPRAYHDMGLRCVMTVSFLDIPFADGRPFLGELLPPELLHELHASPPPTVEEQVDTFEQHRSVWHHPDQRSSVILAPIAPQRCSESLLTEIARRSPRSRTSRSTVMWTRPVCRR